MATRVLIVDDDTNVARMYARALSLEGYDTTPAHSYQEAVGAIKTAVHEEAPFTLAIVDYIMPYIKGDRLARHIRKNHPEMAIIMFSAEPDDRLLHDGFGIADRFIRKPTMLEEVFAVVAEVIAAKEAENARLQRHFLERTLSPNPTPPTLALENANADSEVIVIGDLIADLANHRYILGSTLLDLTLHEAAILTLLVKHAPHPYARSRLERAVEDPENPETAPARLRRVVHSLREKFDAASPGSNPLRTCRGVGYFCDDSESEEISERNS